MVLLVIVVLVLLAWGIYYSRARRRRQLLRFQQLRQWAGREDLLAPATQQWVMRLPDEEAKVLLDLLDGYCASLNWELDWLFARQIASAPALRAALDESVAEYAQAVLRSLQMEADVHAYQVYLAFDKKPTARKRRVLVDQLYAKVNDEKLTPSTGRLRRRFARKEPSRKDKATVIRQAFDRDPDHAMAALKQVLADDVTLTVEQVRAAPAVAPSVA